MHRKHGIDRGIDVTEGSGAPVGLGCPLRKSYNVLPTHCTAPDFRDLVRRLSNRYCPLAYLTAVNHPTSRLCMDCRNSVCRNRVCRNSVVYPYETSTVSQKKLCQLIFCSLSVKYEPISIKIVRIVPEETLNKTVPKMPTSPKVCACTTFGNLKCQIELLTQ